MRKLIGLILLVSMVISAIAPVSGFAGEIDFLVAESYNDQITGVTPGGNAVAGGTAKIVVTQENKDKAVELSGTAQDSSLYYAVKPGENNVTMYADLLYSKAYTATEFYITNSSDKTFNLAYINDKGEIFSGDNRIATGVPKDRDTFIRITYNTKRQKVTICLGDRALVTNRYLGSSAFTELTGFGIKTKGNAQASLVADNFAICNGTAAIKSRDIPKKSFNPESMAAEVIPDTEAPAADEEEYVGDAVFINRTFDETDRPEFDSLGTTAADNRIAVEESAFTGNKYAILEKKGEAESYISYGGNSSSRYLVMEATFSTDTSAPKSTLFYIRDGDAASMFNAFLNLAANGAVTTSNGIQVAVIEPMKWVNIAVAADVASLTYNVYVDNKLAAEGIPFANKTITCIPHIRIRIQKGSGSGTLLVDNIKVYEGKEPRVIDSSKRTALVPADSVAQSYLGSLKAIHNFASTYYTNKAKSDAKYPFIRESDDTVVFVHAEDLKAIFGEAAVLEGAHLTQADYYNAEATALANGYQVGKMDTRLMFFNKGTISLSDSKMAEIQRYMYNIRPTAEQLRDMFNNVNKNQRPRVLIDADDLTRIKKLYATDPLMQKWGANIIERANSLFGAEAYTYPITGSSMEQVDLAVTDIQCIALAYHLTGESRYAALGWKFVENICKLEHWNPICYLDVGELGFAVAVGYDWLYDTFTDDQRKFIEGNLYDKCVKLTHRLYFGELNGQKDKYYVTWYDSENNWNAVCNGGTMIAAVALFDVYPEVASEMIENANRALEYMMPTYYPAGAWPEGGGYWSYALGYVARTIETFRNAFGTDFNLSKYPGLSNTGWYGTYLSGSTGSYSMGDAGTAFTNNPYVMWCAREYNDPLLMSARMIEFEQFGHKGSVNEMIFYDPGLLGENVKMPLDTYMQGMEVIALREAWYDRGTTFVGAAGGESKRGHGHMDIGSFQIDMAGERFIQDIGAENYNATGYFAANRYKFYRSRPEGHNMYVINYEDSEDYYGIVENSKATGRLVLSKPRGAIGEMDLSEAYAQWATKAIRGYMLSDDRRTVTVRDEIDLINPDSEIIYSLHTKADIEIVNANQAVFTLNGKKMLVTFVTNGTDMTIAQAEAATMSPTVKAMVKDTNNASSNGIKKLVLKVKGTGRLNITAKFKQYDDLMVADYPVEGDISTWTIPDGQVTPLPAVDAIYIDGVLVKDFDPKITGYSYLVASKETVAPTVTVATSNNYEIIPTTGPEGDTLVKVYAPGRTDVYRTYRINFWKKPPLQDIDGMRRYPIAQATASEVPEEANIPDNVFDMDFGTRWAASSTYIKEQWLMLELDDVYPIEKIGVSWMSGDARSYKYRLEISVDGVNWTKLFDGESSGKSAKCEYTQVGGKQAKFVRYIGMGNSINEWNSVTEFEVLGNQR